MRTHPSAERSGIPRLHVHRPRTRKLADQAFAGTDAGDDSTRGDTLEDVFAVPRHEVRVVYYVALAFHHLLER